MGTAAETKSMTMPAWTELLYYSSPAGPIIAHCMEVMVGEYWYANILLADSDAVQQIFQAA